MTHPINYAYYPNETRNNATLYSRCDAIESAWNIKGLPVPFTGGKKWRKPLNGAGVSASSRIVSRYADEGEKGKDVRRIVRRMEERMWRMDWFDEGYDIEDGCTVSQWFYDNSDDVDSDLIPSVYVVGETVVNWPVDPYEADWYYGDYDYDPYDYYADDDWCGHCGGPCEL